MNWIFVVPITVIVAFGVLIEWRKKKRNDYHHIGSSPHTRPGESTNYKMGDNNYTSGGDNF